MDAKLLDQVFVYGTLRRGERNHSLLADARWLDGHRTAACYTLLDLGAYPGVVAGGRTAIVGEVYAITQATLAQLDKLEDYPREYYRERIPTRHGPAWMYVYRHPVPGVSVIASGDWRLR